MTTGSILALLPACALTVAVFVALRAEDLCEEVRWVAFAFVLVAFELEAFVLGVAATVRTFALLVLALWAAANGNVHSSAEDRIAEIVIFVSERI
jgi:hypothetical protein